MRNNTKNPLHFWFIDNFLSPKFKAFIPMMAERRTPGMAVERSRPGITSGTIS